MLVFGQNSMVSYHSSEVVSLSPLSYVSVPDTQSGLGSLGYTG